MTTTPESNLITLLAEAAAAQVADPDAPRRPAIEGKFAVYSTEEGGVVLGIAIADGPMAGEHHQEFRPPLIRMLASFAGGGSKLGALKGIFGRGQ